LAVFVVIASAGVAVPLLMHLVMGARADRRLVAVKNWMANNNKTIMAIVLLIIAAKLIGDGLAVWT
jgi:hypothetical protein